MRRRISRAQQTKNWCVGLFFPPPAYAGSRPTLFLFGFRADALNSHSSFISNGPAAGAFRGPSDLNHSRASKGLQKSSGAFLAWKLGLVVGFASFLGSQPCLCLAGPKIAAFPSHFQGGLARSAPVPPQQNPQAQIRWV